MPKQMSYKDYTIKEESSANKKKSKTNNVSDLKTTTTSMRPSTQDTFQFK